MGIWLIVDFFYQIASRFFNHLNDYFFSRSHAPRGNACPDALRRVEVRLIALPLPQTPALGVHNF